MKTISKILSFAAPLALGVTLAAMLLGHWYLNTPTMELLPLRRVLGWRFLGNPVTRSPSTVTRPADLPSVLACFGE